MVPCVSNPLLTLPVPSDGFHLMDVRSITADSPWFEDVIALGKRNSKYLGQFPRGAFEDAAARGRILGGIDPQGALAGYLLYRMSRTHAAIVHLCVASTARNQGIARFLFEELKSRTEECQGVVLRCRRDFPASKLWPKLGFHPVNERPGKSLTGEPLVVWLYSFGHPDLFTGTEDPLGEHRALVALDANVLYDLQDPVSSATEESKALSADWLSGELNLCVTEEILHEINRSESGSERSRRRKYAERFRRLSAESADEERISSALRPLFPEQMSDNDESDRRHLVIAIAAGAPFFVTRDDRLLDISEEVYAQFGLFVLRPCELVIELDKKVRGSEYAPARMAGSLTEVQRVTTPEIAQLAQTFQDYNRREVKSDFQQRIRELLGDPHTRATYVVRDETGRPMALYTLDRSQEDRIRVPLLRVLRGRLAQGLTHHILWNATNTAAGQGRQWVEVTEPYPPADAEEGFRQLGFVQQAQRWTKLVLRVAGPRITVLEALEAAMEGSPEESQDLTHLLDALSDPARMAYPQVSAEVERLLWPAKVTDASLPSFIVSIKPDWAAQLFDERLASQDLFGAEPHLALSVRNVYYRSAHPRVLKAPARVLWYVKDQKGVIGSMSIRAVSYITEVSVDSAKELYRRFRRLGVYKWADVLGTAKKDPHGQIMAFAFTHTELLQNPIPWTIVQKTLEEIDGARNPLQGPVRISPRCFAELYRVGTTSLAAALVQ